jgi:NAD(P)-dependent dehydrogenase (short-subunit alcohol dehydrogenase family)
VQPTFTLLFHGSSCSIKSSPAEMATRRVRQPSPERTSITTTSSATAKRPEKLWYQHLTLDLIVYVLGRSIFHPAIVYIFYLCIAALHRHRTPVAYYTLYWATFLLVVAGLKWLDYRITHGKPRKMDWENEVVVVTGGGSGLGRVIAEMYAIRGISTAILDIKEADPEAIDLIDGGNGSLQWFWCDVSDKDGVDIVMDVIRQKMGNPTILINNAASGIVAKTLCQTGKSQGLSADEAVKTVSVDLLAHFYTMTNVLRGSTSFSSSSKPGLTVVTISSVLAHLSPARLSDYAAAKAAVSSLHHAFTNELRLDDNLRTNIKPILVELGQMDTDLFASIKIPWYASFVGPVVEAKDVARAIVDAVDSGEGGIVRMPFYATLVPWYTVMPGSFQILLRWASGIDRSLP